MRFNCEQKGKERERWGEQGKAKAMLLHLIRMEEKRVFWEERERAGGGFFDFLSKKDSFLSPSCWIYPGQQQSGQHQKGRHRDWGFHSLLLP